MWALETLDGNCVLSCTGDEVREGSKTAAIELGILLQALIFRSREHGKELKLT